MNRLVKIGAPVLGALVLVILALWMGGVFASGVVDPGKRDGPDTGAAPTTTREVGTTRRVMAYTAVGTVRPVGESTLAAQVPGKVAEVLVREGDRVKRGQLLVRLEDAEFRTRVAQAESGLKAAQAALTAAEKALTRTRELRKAEAVTLERLEGVESRHAQAAAAVTTAEEKVTEAKTVLGYAELASPLDGVVVARQAEPGDLAWPGRPLVTVYDPAQLRLEADVREGLRHMIRIGTEVTVALEALDLELKATIDEIVPSADPVSRSFRVKITLPSKPGLYAGMFGTLALMTGERDAVVIPEAAVRRVGQLATVRVRSGGGWLPRHVTLGPLADGNREILSGLRPGDTIGWDE